jgi:hypothetical protein
LEPVVATKYGRFGKPKKKFVYMSKDMRAICWRPFDVEEFQSKREIDA